MNEINIEYMEWLERTIMTYGNFDTKRIEYHNISNTDRLNIKKLSNLYDTIDKYAKENGIEEYWSNNHSSYNISYNDSYYNIVKSHDDDTFMCLKRKDKDLDYYIDVNKIIEKEPNKVYTK